ncbi:phosphopantothenoylcysteine decarboxylase [Synergistales bacterium]|nr:phosphopantothenoylcysteine decarboxylase [Synergistales bacterium]
MVPSWARGKKILLGISGGIAAYKTAALTRAFVKSGCEVEIIMTDAGAKFVSPLALSTLTKRRVWRDADFLSDEYGFMIPHISLTQWADVMVIAPCTGNALRIAATGDASTLLGAALLACGRPKVFFPAMNERMLDNPAAQENIKIIRSRGGIVIDPGVGFLACADEGKGRLLSADEILDETWRAISPIRDLSGKKILITAGATHEYLDPVRFISNPSSGKMGYALAEEALRRGASVSLVSGPSEERVPSGAKLIGVRSALEMLDACLAELNGADAIIKAAAVGDYRAKEIASRKIKREFADSLTIELVRNPDIAREISLRKSNAQILAGFAAETDDVEANAVRKITAKGLDMIVANDVSKGDAGFAADTNRVRIYFDEKYARPPSQVIFGTKQDVAASVIDELTELVNSKTPD